MRSNITQQMVDEYASGHVKPIILAELYFDSGTIYVFSGLGTLDFNGNTYLGGGKFIGCSAPKETQDTQANGIVCSLNGVDSSLIATSLQEKSRGRPFRLYLGAISTTQYLITEDTVDPDNPYYVLTEDGYKILLENQLVDAPYRIFSGLMDVMEFTDDGVQGDIKLAVENILIIGQRAKIGRYTNEDQTRRFPNDKGLSLINQLMDKSIVW